MVVAEAMACGTPVVASRICGIPHMIRHEQTGLLFDAGNASELADQLERLLTDPAWAAQLGAAARAVARQCHHPSVVARQTRAAYETVLGDPPNVRV
jgi:glycosyltransferase involved in cell wall biosynthesis